MLDGVDLTIPRGSVFALLGPNGAGKTTAVRILATLTEADAGRARVGGAELKQRVAAQRLDLTAASEAAYDDLTRHLGDRAIHRDHASLTLGCRPTAAPPRCGRGSTRPIPAAPASPASPCEPPASTTFS